MRFNDLKYDKDFYKNFNNLILDKKYSWFTVMNHGYYPSSDKFKSSFIFKNSATLYLKAIDGLDTENKILLDIGCGRGGGVSIFKEHFNFNEIHACDNNDQSIVFCKNTHKDINFELCEDQNLKFKNNYFDIITCIESMHRYLSIDLFLEETKRVLKFGGRLCLAGVVKKNNLTKIQDDIYNSNVYPIIEEYDITPFVLNSCYDFLKNSLPLIEDGEFKQYIEKTYNSQIYFYKEGINTFRIWRCYS